MTTAILNGLYQTNCTKSFSQPRRSPSDITTTINCIPSLSSLHNFDENKRLYSSGAYYIGKLEGCRRNGWGKLKWSKDCYHEGYYLNNKKDGEGVHTWNDGSLYKGDFKNDLRHGYGELIWPNGEVEQIYTLKFQSQYKCSLYFCLMTYTRIQQAFSYQCIIREVIIIEGCTFMIGVYRSSKYLYFRGYVTLN